MKIFIVDAFADRPFAGNPAAVCFLDSEKDSKWMQSVASEMNLSETAFVRKLVDGYEIRWFTPVFEVELCGHATLASAHLLWTEGVVSLNKAIRFNTKSGVLTCTNKDGLIELDFPATHARESSPPAGLLDALGINPSFVGRSQYDSLIIAESEEVVRSLQPDFGMLAKIPVRGVIVSSSSEDPSHDFISRFFALAAGVNEDPVTGSAHCCLGPYWSERLGKATMTAFQASTRGGIVRIRVVDDRVILGGRAITVVRGELQAGGCDD